MLQFGVWIGTPEARKEVGVNAGSQPRDIESRSNAEYIKKLMKVTKKRQGQEAFGDSDH